MLTSLSGIQVTKIVPEYKKMDPDTNEKLKSLGIDIFKLGDKEEKAISSPEKQLSSSPRNKGAILSPIKTPPPSKVRAPMHLRTPTSSPVRNQGNRRGSQLEGYSRQKKSYFK